MWLTSSQPRREDVKVEVDDPHAASPHPLVKSFLLPLQRAFKTDGSAGASATSGRRR